MNFYISIITAGLAAIICWAAGTWLTRNQQFSLGRGRYTGAFPFIGAVAGSIFYNVDLQADCLWLAVTTILLGLIGYLRDRYRVSYQSLLPWAIIAASVGLTMSLPGADAIRVSSGLVWAALIIFCLKISALVYEMPFVLLSMSSLAQFIFFATGNHSQTAAFFNAAILVASLLLLAYSISGQRVLIGSSGIFAAGFLLAAVSQLEGSGNLILFGLFIPSMVIFFPFALISAMIVASYFGNRLHKPGAALERQWSWSLHREKTVVFSGLIFLCLNFFGLLVLVEAPAFGYFALFLLLVSSLFGFARTFARRVESNATVPARIEILDIFIDAVLPTQVIDCIAGYLGAKPGNLMHIITADSLALVRAGEEQRFRSVMQRAEMVVPDGAGIVWASDFIGTPLPGRVPGVALVSQICERACQEGWKLFFIGGKPGIAAQAAQILKQNYSIEICGIEHGYFAQDSEEEDAVLRKIATARPDIVFVALGVPRQEWFISKLRTCLNHGVAIGVGGSFDVISQTLPRAPLWMQQCGIEWLFRLWLEPSRFMRMLKIPVFVLQILRHKWNQPETGT